MITIIYQSLAGIILNATLLLKIIKTVFGGIWWVVEPSTGRSPAVAEKVSGQSYQIIVADAADAVSVNFSGRCKFLQI